MTTPRISFEFFPPQTLDASFRLWETVQALAPMKPNFVSVTYGAGGTTRKLTHEAVSTIAKHYGLNVAAHLTCVDATRAETLEIAESYAAAGVTEIVALRGDAPKGAERFTAHPEGFASSVELVEALAKTGKESTLKGKDKVNGYILLATSCDGTLATTATLTSIRVVCNNTLTVALNGATSAVKVPHSTTFDGQAVKKQLGIAVSHWDGFMYRMKTLSERKVKTHESMNYFLKVICHQDATPDQSTGLSNERALKKVLAMYEGHGRGAELSAAKGTAWGLLCSITEFVDHERRARSQEYRLDSAWFGQGANLKQRALDHALQLAS